jgi:hypothetical protein
LCNKNKGAARGENMEERVIRLNEVEFVLGRRYRDSVLDISGIATAGASYLTGCDQILLSAKDSNGMPFGHWVDVTRIAGIEVEQRNGGPAPVIPSRHP